MKQEIIKIIKHLMEVISTIDIQPIIQYIIPIIIISCSFFVICHWFCSMKRLERTDADRIVFSGCVIIIIFIVGVVLLLY